MIPCCTCQPRRTFLRTSVLGGIGLLVARRSSAADRVAKRGAPPGWARLITSYRECSRHDVEDPLITERIRANGVEISSQVYNVAISDLAGMRDYPMLFTDNLAEVKDQRGLEALRDYLYGGGFLYIDGCGNPAVTPSFYRFHVSHLALFDRWLPGAPIARLLEAHEIFRALYPVSEKELIGGNHRPTGPSQMAKASHGLWGVYDDDRLMVVLSQHCLRCAWDQSDREAELQQQLAANIHAYAIRRSRIVS